MSRVRVRGTAIVSGTSRNGIHYSVEELQRTFNELSNVPILKDHVATTDNTIGRTTSAHFRMEGEKAKVDYEGWITGDAVEKVRDGRVNNVSIGAYAERMVKESEDSDHLIAQGIHYMELSTTPTPGVVGTSMVTMEAAQIVETFDAAPDTKKQDAALQRGNEAMVEENNSAAAKQLEEIKTQLMEAQKQLQELKESKKKALLSEVLRISPKLNEKALETFNESQLIALKESLEIVKETKPELKSEVIVEHKIDVEERKLIVGYHEGIFEMWSEPPRPNVNSFLSTFGGN